MLRTQDTTAATEATKNADIKIVEKPIEAADKSSSNAATSNTAPPSSAPQITVSETKVTKTTPEVEPSSPLVTLLMWLPLIVAMGLWLYLRGKNQAAMRAREEALTLAAKKAKKSSRSQNAAVKMDDATQNAVQSAATSKSKSKKNKKDKQKKKQSTGSGAVASKAPQSVPTQQSAAKQPLASTSQSPVATSLGTAAAPADLASQAKQTTATPAANAPVVNKAIFEPLRKVTPTVPQIVSDESADGQTRAEVSDDKSDDNSSYSRKRRSSPPPPAIVTTPTKVSSGRFEKLNTSAATIGIGASNRWPAEATQPVTPARAVTTEPQAKRDSTARTPAAPVTGRGLGAFVKTNKTTDATVPDTDSPFADEAASQTHSAESTNSNNDESSRA